MSGLFSIGNYESFLSPVEYNVNVNRERISEAFLARNLTLCQSSILSQSHVVRELHSQQRISKNLCIRSRLCIFLRHPRRAQATPQDLSSNCRPSSTIDHSSHLPPTTQWHRLRTAPYAYLTGPYSANAPTTPYDGDSQQHQPRTPNMTSSRDHPLPHPPPFEIDSHLFTNGGLSPQLLNDPPKPSNKPNPANGSAPSAGPPACSSSSPESV